MPFKKLGRSVKRWIRSVVPGPEFTRFPITPWYEASLTEPNVQVALNDLCRPGMTVFDVGANVGALSLCLSRAVGPTGRVCSFEASPRIVGKCQYNLAINGCNNVTIYHRAVYSRSGETVRFHFGDHSNACADSLIKSADSTDESVEVVTISLDDFSDYFGTVPALIKMDIEGAEYDALIGAERLLAQHAPHVILEITEQNARCIDLLIGKGYVAVDLSTLRQIASAQDFPNGVGIENILFVHSSKIADTPYRTPIPRQSVAELTEADFATNAQGDRESTRPLRLAPGRYHFQTRFEGGAENEAHVGVEADGKIIFRYQADLAFLSRYYQDWIVDVKKEASIRIFLRFLQGTSDAAARFRSVSISRIDAPIQRPIWIP